MRPALWCMVDKYDRHEAIVTYEGSPDLVAEWNRTFPSRAPWFHVPLYSAISIREAILSFPMPHGRDNLLLNDLADHVQQVMGGAEEPDVEWEKAEHEHRREHDKENDS